MFNILQTEILNGNKLANDFSLHSHVTFSWQIMDLCSGMWRYKVVDVKEIV